MGGGQLQNERSERENWRNRRAARVDVWLSRRLSARPWGDQRENERTAREDGRKQRAILHDVWPLKCLSPRPTLGPTIDLVWKTETLAIGEREMHS